MTMSWLAEVKATMIANSAVIAGSSAGDVEARPRMAAINATWVVTAQARRRPRRALRTGNGTRSTRGAHRNLKV